MHPDGYLQLKDRSRDIIISGGENISSIKVEGVLYRHLAGYKVAGQVEFTQIPRRSTGKIQTFALRDAARNLKD